MRKRTRRKHYQATTPAIAFVIEGVRPIDDRKAQLLLAAEHEALDAFRTGTATQKHWRTIADVVNLAETLAGMGVGRDEVSPVLSSVEQHLGAAHQGFLRTNCIETTPDGLQAMQDLVEYHHLQRTAIDLATLERAIQTTMNRIRAAHPSVKVYG